MRLTSMAGAAGMAAIVALGAAPAVAADVPNLVGTWKAVDGEGVVVRYGAASEHNPEEKAPTIVSSTGQSWTIVVETQEGRAFHGHAVSPNGKKDIFVGVIHRDGEHLVLSGTDGEMEGEFDDGKLDLCWTDDLPGRAVVACWLLAKQ